MRGFGHRTQQMRQVPRFLGFEDTVATDVDTGDSALTQGVADMRGLETITHQHRDIVGRQVSFTNFGLTALTQIEQTGDLYGTAAGHLRACP
jgi:hypothetical protein